MEKTQTSSITAMKQLLIVSDTSISMCLLDTFIEKLKLPKLTQEGAENLNAHH